MEANTQLWPTSRVSSRVFRSRLPYHQTRAGNDPLLMRLHDAAICPGAQTEVVRINDEEAISSHALVNCLDEKALVFAIIQFRDLRPSALCFLKRASIHPRESGFQ